MEQHNTIMKAIDYIEGHLEDNLRLDEVARSVGYSKFHLNRLFAESVGHTLYKYIQTRRLTMAAEKLVHTTLPIIEIAHGAHYDSQQSFTLAFRQLYFCTPQSYRMRGIHIPKLDRFTLSNGLGTRYFSAGKSEGRAA